jgi:hypothetical protein
MNTARVSACQNRSWSAIHARRGPRLRRLIWFGTATLMLAAVSTGALTLAAALDLAPAAIEGSRFGIVSGVAMTVLCPLFALGLFVPYEQEELADLARVDKFLALRRDPGEREVQRKHDSMLVRQGPLVGWLTVMTFGIMLALCIALPFQVWIKLHDQAASLDPMTLSPMELAFVAAPTFFCVRLRVQLLMGLACVRAAASEVPPVRSSE